MKLIVLIIALAAAFPASGAVPNLPTDKSLLAFLEDGKTMREEVMLKLGHPSMTFESDRILTYKIGYEGEHYVVRRGETGWKRARLSLVLVFGPDEKLEKHSLVKIR